MSHCAAQEKLSWLDDIAAHCEKAKAKQLFDGAVMEAGGTYGHLTINIFHYNFKIIVKNGAGALWPLRRLCDGREHLR